MEINPDRNDPGPQEFQGEKKLITAFEVPKKQETKGLEQARKEIKALKREAYARDNAELASVRETLKGKNEAPEEQTPEAGLLSVEQRLEDFLVDVKNLTPEQAKDWREQTINQFAEIMNALGQYAKEVRPREEMEDIFASIQKIYSQAIGELTKKLGKGFLTRFIDTITETSVLVNQRLNEIKEGKIASAKEIAKKEPEKNEEKGFMAKIRGLFRRK